MADYQSIESPAEKSCWQKHKVIWSILFALCVGAIILLVVLLVQKDKDEESQVLLPAFTFNDAFNSSYSPRYASLYWTSNPDEDAYTSYQNNCIYKYTMPNFQQGQVLLNLTNVIDPNTHQPIQMYDYVFSSDQQWILFRTNHIPIYRYSSNDTYILVRTNDGRVVNVANGTPLRYATLSTQGLLLAYVLDNNIYTFDWNANITVQVTTDGLFNTIINGICDWVFEEEVFGQTGALWWSPDATRFAFLRFKEGPVPEYQFPLYQIPYNQEFVYKYPKAGAVNSIVELGVYTVGNPNITWPNINAQIYPDQYVIELTWFTSTNVVVKTMPRLQSSYQILSVDVVNNVTTNLFSEHHPLYLEQHGTLRFLNNTDYYLDLIVDQGYDHLGLFNATSGALIKMLTSTSINSPNWSVTAVLGYHKPLEVVFVQTTENVGSMERAIWGVRITDASRARLVFSTQKVYQSATFSASGLYFVLRDSGENVSSALYRINPDLTTTLIQVLQDNAQVLANLAQKSMPKQFFLPIPHSFGTTGGYDLNSFFLGPPNWDLQNCNKKYPVLMYVYGGPGNQQVTHTYPASSGRTNWHNYLVSSLGFLVFIFDGIGTGGRGDAFQKNFTYMNLGVNESSDVIAAAKYLQSCCFVDPNKIALWGWSYGGYLSSMVAGEKSVRSHINTIMAVAPVTTWELYDSIYTERYMRTPQNNSAGYSGSSVLNRIDPNQWVSNYLLVHGTGDDNVHFQNGAMIADALVQKNIQFETMFYPNRAHSLVGPSGEQNTHLYTLLTNFLLETLNLTDS